MGVLYLRAVIDRIVRRHGEAPLGMFMSMFPEEEDSY